MKRVEGWVELERKLTQLDDWQTNMQFHPEVSIEQARVIIERAIVNRPFDETEYRLVHVRVETTRKILD